MARAILSRGIHPFPALSRTLAPLVAAVAAAVQHDASDGGRREWSWPSSSLWPRVAGCARHAEIADAGCVRCYLATQPRPRRRRAARKES